LAKKTIKRTSLIKDSRIFVAIFNATGVSILWITGSSSGRTDPGSYTVSRQRIVIPANIALICSGSHQSPFFVNAQPAIARGVL
jgi:uncharacterized membrane-anchored protein YitT (DUF2179 family)